MVMKHLCFLYDVPSLKGSRSHQQAYILHRNITVVTNNEGTQYTTVVTPPPGGPTRGPPIVMAYYGDRHYEATRPINISPLDWEQDGRFAEGSLLIWLVACPARVFAM